MRVNEIFSSIQGEGSTIGKPAVFVRLSGCNLKCDFCDSKYAMEEKGKEVTIEKLKEQIIKQPLDRIVFTGGEPMLQIRELSKLIDELHQYSKEFKFEIETNGTIRNTHITHAEFNISPKAELINYESLEDYLRTEECIFKFVIKDPIDFKFWKRNVVDRMEIPPEKVYLMPMGTNVTTIDIRSRMLVRFCKKYGYNLSPRLHIMLWGNDRGK